MSQAITHFAVGATATLLVVTLFVPDVRYPRTWVLVGGGWALVPDAGNLVDIPVLQTFHYSIWADLCWGHATLDRVDATDSTLVASAAVAALLVATALAEHRAYAVPEPVSEHLGIGEVGDDERS